MGEPTDADVKEVVQAIRMLKSFEAAYHCAEARCARLTVRAIEKATAWLKEQSQNKNAFEKEHETK